MMLGRVQGLRRLLVSLAMILAACSAGPPDPSDPSAVTGRESLTISVEPGDVVASVELEPHAEAVIEATGADGSRFVLELAASSVAAPTTVSLRPLTRAEIPGGTLVAGVEIEPSGLHLFFPATLTIIPASDGGASSLVPLEYQGSAAATAILAAIVPGSGLNDHQLLLTHFSGGMLGSVDAATRDALWTEAYQTSRAPNRDTPEGRQAQADVGQRAVDYALETGAISAETADAARTRWQEQWWEAEADRLSNDPQLKQAIESGNPGDLDTVRTELGKVMEAALRLDQSGEATPASNAARATVTTLAKEYARRMVEHLRGDEVFQEKLTSGRVSDLAEVQAIFEALVGLGKQFEALGVPLSGDPTFSALLEFMRKLAPAVGASCAQAPILPELAIGLTRQAILLGDEASADLLAPCLPVACPGGTSLETGIATASMRAFTAPGDRGAPVQLDHRGGLAEDSVVLAGVMVAQNVCVPLPQSWVGSASATHRVGAEGDEWIVTQAATQVVFDLLPASSESDGSYVIVGGSLSWTMSGTAGDCTIHGDGTEALGPGDGSLGIHGVPLTYTASGDTADFTRTATWTCPDGSLELPAFVYPWLSTGILPYDPTQPRLEGRYASEFGAGSGTTAEWTWSFVPGN